MKEKVFELLRTSWGEPETSPLTFDDICERLNASPVKRFAVGQAIIDLIAEKRVSGVNIEGIGHYYPCEADSV